MCIPGNIDRRSRTTAALAALLLVAGAPSASWADNPPHRGAWRLPDPADVVNAYMTARSWVDDFDAPALDEPAARVQMQGTSGVCVILRRSGRVIGTGTDAGGDDLMLRRAIGRALGEVWGDPAVANLPPEVARTVGRGLVLEIDVAGDRVPLPGRTTAEAAAQLEPGLDGLAMRRGDVWATLFPAQMRARNAADEPHRHLPALARELGLTPAPLEELIRAHDVTVYRFRTTHLAQRRPDQPPFETVRGDVLVADTQVTPQAIARSADLIAGHLVGTIYPRSEPIGVMGTYRPVANRYEPVVAPPLEQALVALALARYAEAPGVDGDTAAAAAAASERILRELQLVLPTEADPVAGAAAAAAIVHAALARENRAYAGLLEDAIGRVKSVYTHEGGFRDRTGELGELPLPPHGRALVASALARLARTGRGDVPTALARSAIDAAWESVPPNEQVSLLPWLGWAESDWAAAAGEPSPAASRLVRLRKALDDSRVGSAGRPGPADLHGGFALGSGRRAVATAQSLRPAAFLAAMVRDRRLTPPAEVDAVLGRHLATVRFLMQLTVREESCWAYRSPARALGGVRQAPWDCDQPPPASALALLTAAETLWTVQELARREP